LGECMHDQLIGGGPAARGSWAPLCREVNLKDEPEKLPRLSETSLEAWRFQAVEAVKDS